MIAVLCSLEVWPTLSVVLVVLSCLLFVVLSAPCRHALVFVMPGIVSSLLATLEVVMQRQVPSFQTVQKTVEVIQPVSQERIQERITEQVVDIPLPHIMEEMMKKERSTLQNRCVLRCCAGVDVVQYSFHPARILRAQAIRSRVSSHSVETESTEGMQVDNIKPLRLWSRCDGLCRKSSMRKWRNCTFK